MGVSECALRLSGALKIYRISDISEIHIYDPIYGLYTPPFRLARPVAQVRDPVDCAPELESPVKI